MVLFLKNCHIWKSCFFVKIILIGDRKYDSLKGVQIIMKSVKKLTITAMFTAIGTITSHLIFIPVGIVKAFPMQHFLNVVSAIILGPFYAVLQAFAVSLLRNMIGTGSLFAFPGSLFGALLAGWMYKRFKKVGLAAIGEVVGTGILGALASYPLAALFLGQKTALFAFMPAFLISSLTGSILGFILIKILIKKNVFSTMMRRLLQ